MPTPSDSKFEYTPEERETMSKFTTNAQLVEWLKANRDESLLATGQFQRDIFSPEILIPTDAPSAERGHLYARSVVVDGKRFVLEGASDAELNQKEIEIYRAAFQSPTAAPQSEPMQTATLTDDEQAEIARRTDLQLQMQTGQITMQEYIEQSGAIEEYLAKRGVSIENLQAQSANAYRQSWEDATRTFLDNAGSQWPGGKKNLETVTAIMEANPELADAQDKVAALAAAFNYMKQNNLLDTSEIDARKQNAETINSATDFETLQRAARRASGIPEEGAGY